MLSLRARRAIPLYFSCLTAFTSIPTLADNTLFTAMDDPSTAKKPFDGNIQAGYNAQSGNSQNSTLLANTTMTWFNNDAAYSLWGAANNSTSSNVRSSERYQASGRTRQNLTSRNYMFGQAGWLNDRFNGYNSRTTVTGGYGRQIFNGSLHDLRVEFGPGVRHDEYRGGGRSTRALAYGAANYSYRLTDNARFSEGLSALANDETTINSETALNVSINNDFSLRLAYTVTYNSKPPASAPKNTDTTTSVTLVYGL
jgi:putative salt-induced outer membrane protein